ncbi:MAG: enoyl-[acyl-carrier-protein] reductase FabK [Clostridia bacterium]|nr:MAG: enoyl-[acyl-carrier-protein] reductase FabK [Clostridia bacterium]
MFRTVLCDLLGIEYPIFQGGMAWAATGELAAAVSAAGGLGIIAAAHLDGTGLRQEIAKVKAATDRPFGVNVMLRSPYVDELFATILQERVPVVTTGAGNPGKWVPALKEKGIRVIPVVSSVALAQRLTRVGSDAFIAEGEESGGHIGEISTAVIVPQVVDAVRVPVIAAGGIADGRGLAAALAWGAVGVQMGTVFLCAEECTIHPRVKERIIQARDRDTVVTGRPTGHPVRVLRNKLTRQYEEMESRGASTQELEALGTGKLRAAMVLGDVEYGSLMAGQVAAMVKQVRPARDIICSVMEQAETVMRDLAARYTG